MVPIMKSYFTEVVPPWKRGVWRRFVVVEKKTLSLTTRKSAPKVDAATYAIVSRHFTLSGADRKSQRLNAAEKASKTFEGDR